MPSTAKTGITTISRAYLGSRSPRRSLSMSHQTTALAAKTSHDRINGCHDKTASSSAVEIRTSSEATTCDRSSSTRLESTKQRTKLKPTLVARQETTTNQSREPETGAARRRSPTRVPDGGLTLPASLPQRVSRDYAV